MRNNKTFISIVDRVMETAKKKGDTLFELSIIMGVVGLFATISILTAASRDVISGPGIIVLAVLLDLATISCFLLITVKQFADICLRYLNYIKKKKIIFILCAVFIVLAAFQFDNIPRGDANYYYGRIMYGTEQYENTILSFITNYLPWNHVMHGLCLFLGIGEMLFPRQVVGVYVISLILTVISFLCLYGILNHLYPKTSNITKSIGTAVLMFNPYILGLFTYINPDYFVCIFAVIMVYCYLKELNILFIFFGIIISLTKEPGAVIYCAFVAGVVINDFVNNKGSFIERARNSIFSLKRITYFLPPIIFTIFFIACRQITVDRSILISKEMSWETPKADVYSNFIWDSNGKNNFGFKPTYIIQRLIQFYISNSIWLTSIICISGLFVFIYKFYIKRQKSSLSQKRESVFMGIVSILIVYTIFTCLFITEYCPRYVTIGGFCLAVFAFASVRVLFRKKAMRNIVLGLLALLFLVQTYINIDPYMHLRSFNSYTGKRFIYGAVYKEVPIGWAGDSRNFNYEYRFYESMLKKILTYIDPDEDTIIVQAIVTHVELALCGLETSIYWNTRTKKRTYDHKDPDSIYLKVPVLEEPDDVKKYVFPDTFYLITIPYYDNYTQQFLREFAERRYAVSDVYRAENTVGFMTVYKMSKS